MIKKRETVGKLSRDLTLKNDKVTHSATEQMNEQLSEYETNVRQCLDENKKKIDKDFYIVVITKKERLMQNVLRNYFYARLSCPTPDYDQILYKYIKKDDKLDFMWVIPDRTTCKKFRDHTKEVNPTQYDLLSFVLKYADGTLFRIAKKLNGEKDDSPLLIKG